MREVLNVLLPKILPPEIDFLLLTHEGKSDLEVSIARKLKAWKYPDDSFMVLRDNDGSDCKRLKAKLILS